MSFVALALRARATNDTTRAQINNIPEKSHFIPLLKSPSEKGEGKEEGGGEKRPGNTRNCFIAGFGDQPSVTSFSKPN